MRLRVPPKLKGLLWIAGVLAIAGGFAVGFGLAVREIPRSLEARMGRSLMSFPRGQLCHRPDSVVALRAVVKRLYPQSNQERTLPLSVSVIRNGPLNAFASLGPRIYVYETLLEKARSPEELAGVLAHEMGHVTERHVLDSVAFRVLLIPFFAIFSGSGSAKYADAINSLAQMKFSREQEYEADVDGLERLQKADVDTGALARFFGRLKESSGVFALLSDHPSSESRAELAMLYPVKHPRPVLTETQWRVLRGICQD